MRTIALMAAALAAAGAASAAPTIEAIGFGAGCAQADLGAGCYEGSSTWHENGVVSLQSNGKSLEIDLGFLPGAYYGGQLAIDGVKPDTVYDMTVNISLASELADDRYRSSFVTYWFRDEMFVTSRGATTTAYGDPWFFSSNYLLSHYQFYEPGSDRVVTWQGAPTDTGRLGTAVNTVTFSIRSGSDGQIVISTVPEPQTCALMAAGLLAVGFARRAGGRPTTTRVVGVR